MSEVKVLSSELDSSVNFIFPAEKGMFEARYVRRKDDYIVVYLSSQSGCKQACRMCHLTATKQTKLINATFVEYLDQAKIVLEHHRNNVLTKNAPKAKIVHYNFMARGEPLSNPHLNDDVLMRLGNLALAEGMTPRFLISTIMPKERGKELLTEKFNLMEPEIYYSIYSTNAEFRKKWLPKALPVEDAMELLADYQWRTRKLIKLHWAFIKDENDHPEDVMNIIKLVKKHELRCDFNIVRYNPYSAKFGKESPIREIENNVWLLKHHFPESSVKIIDRVGMDVKASCGTFIESMI